ncbi:DUF1304 domain-containing protein [Parasphingorhabdus litoris]|uniref:DUF1304 domain-containing protein n=1 Tax=Parasphingorhabdus litoris TaxID=394733 RepID=A0ABP3JUM0_9SPHN|nr:DUF1304 domain-containing protein [Parasphingorhabdus litoris]
MSKLAAIAIGAIAVLHSYIAWFEIFAWTSVGPRVFSNFPPDLFEQTKALAANQGIYNAFLAVGLFWSLFIRDAKWQRRVSTCFLLFVATAGIFGAITVSPRIALVQTLPAAIAMALLFLTGKNKR